MAWNQTALSGSPKRAQERLFVNSFSYSKDPSVLEIPGPWHYYQGQQQVARSWPETTGKLCVLQMAETEKWRCPGPFESRR